MEYMDSFVVFSFGAWMIWFANNKKALLGDKFKFWRYGGFAMILIELMRLALASWMSRGT